MNRKHPDWADKRSDKFYKELNGDGDLHNWFARELRAAEKRGYMRAVKLLRAEPGSFVDADATADWLEEEGRK